MSKLPLISVSNFEKLLFELEFEFIRQKGSHRFYRHSDGRYTTLPFHGNQVLARPLIRQILREIEISPEEFIRLKK